ncbi:hypothetical protein JCM8547_000287 [Rhodosporidiobolus lusitaniae]
MAALINKLKDVIAPNHAPESEERGRSSGTHTPTHPSHLNPAHADQPRSVSRGRSAPGLVPTGRGGAGNMSRSRVRDGSAPTESLAEVEAARSRSRSRARAGHHGEDLPVASGRGGLGNVHSEKERVGSREREARIEEEEREVERKFEEKHQHDKFLSGRGGAGNAAHA